MNAGEIIDRVVFPDETLGADAYAIPTIELDRGVLNRAAAIDINTHSGGGSWAHIRVVKVGGAMAERTPVISIDAGGDRDGACIEGSGAIRKGRTGGRVNPKGTAVQRGRAIGEGRAGARANSNRHHIIRGGAVA